MRLFQAALDTPLDSPFSATLSVHGSHFTVYAASRKPAWPHGASKATLLDATKALKTLSEIYLSHVAQDVCPFSFFRAELKVTHLRWRSPICGFLRFPAKIGGFLRKSAPSKCLNFQEKGWICGFLRKSAFWALSVTLVKSPDFSSSNSFLFPGAGWNLDFPFLSSFNRVSTTRPTCQLNN